MSAAGTLAGLGNLGQKGKMDQEKSLGMLGMSQDDAKRTRGCSGRLWDLTWEGIVFLVLLKSGKMI